jgi:hypothetical protein
MTGEPEAIIQHAERDRGPPLAACGEHLLWRDNQDENADEGGPKGGRSPTVGPPPSAALFSKARWQSGAAGARSRGAPLFS